MELKTAGPQRRQCQIYYQALGRARAWHEAIQTKEEGKKMRTGYVIITHNPYNFGSSSTLLHPTKFKSVKQAYEFGIGKWGSGSHQVPGGWEILKVRY
jgi:hypothetical protein